MPSDKFKFTPQHKEIITHAVQGHLPGSILQDFETLLDIVKKKPIQLTPSHLLAMKSLSDLNQALSHPIETNLKRPQQKSYPHLNGLYLLLRASGITIVDATGKKPMLVLNDEVYQQWQKLNPTERYCTLLETWLLRGKTDIIGDYSRWGLPDHLRNWAWFFERMPDGGLQIKGNRDNEEAIKFFPGLVNIGLLDLFGLISVERGEPLAGEGWQIERIKPTPFGEALLALLQTSILTNAQKLLDIDFESEQHEGIGIFQPILQPYFTEWKQTLSLPEWDFREGTYTFKVSLGSTWCRIAIGAKQTLDELAYTILGFVKFDSDHLHEFIYRNRLGTEQHVQHPYMDEPPFTSEVRIGDLPLSVGQDMMYRFDFGDNWEFNVVLEKIEEKGKTTHGKILEQHGTPPEQYPNWDDYDEEYEDEE